MNDPFEILKAEHAKAVELESRSRLHGRLNAALFLLAVILAAYLLFS